MSYDSSNPPRVIVEGGFPSSKQGGPGRVYLYSSADPYLTVIAAGYFSNALALGINVGDVFIVISTANSTCTLHSVITMTLSGQAGYQTATATLSTP